MSKKTEPVPESDEEKIAAINAMLRRNRGSGSVDGEKALKELRDEYLAMAQQDEADTEVLDALKHAKNQNEPTRPAARFFAEVNPAEKD